jgi:predicted small integral membrane protein
MKFKVAHYLPHLRIFLTDFFSMRREMGKTMLIRFSKLMIIFCLAIFFSLVSIDNIFDYESNFHFVEHVLSMDTVFPSNQCLWRAIRSPLIHHGVYWSIIIWELSAGLLLWTGLFKLFTVFRSAGNVFNQAKGFAILGLTVGLCLMLFGFIIVGGEWFSMWQSEKWNGLDAALRVATVSGLAVLFLNQNDT